jgi:hypothetical protein
MKNLKLFISFCLVSQMLHANDLKKALSKAEQELKQKAKEVDAGLKHLASRNEKEIQALEEEFETIKKNISQTAEIAYDDVMAEGTRVSKTLKQDWEKFKERMKQEQAQEKLPAISEEDKKLSGLRVYNKMTLINYVVNADITSFEYFVKTYEKTLHEEGLNPEDSIYVKSEETGNTLLHALVKQASTVEMKILKAKQEAQLRGMPAPRLEESVAYEQILLMITYLAERTTMGSIKNHKQQLSIDLILDAAPMSIALAQHLVLHDLTNASRNRLKEKYNQ